MGGGLQEYYISPMVQVNCIWGHEFVTWCPFGGNLLFYECGQPVKASYAPFLLLWYTWQVTFPCPIYPKLYAVSDTRFLFKRRVNNITLYPSKSGTTWEFKLKSNISFTTDKATLENKHTAFVKMSLYFTPVLGAVYTRRNLLIRYVSGKVKIKYLLHYSEPQYQD